IDRIGYNKSDYQFDAASCGILSAIHEQSSDINQGVVRQTEEEQGAGDQGIMFGYACNETRELMPATLILSHVILKELAVIRREGEVMTYLRPDSKSQVTIEYGDDRKPQRVHTIVVSTQHDEFIKAGEGMTEKEAEKAMQDKIREDVRTILIPRVKARLERANDALAELIGDEYILHVNPTGKFVIGGPHGDTGLTGRKIIVDTYGGRGAHGGGAFSGKDSSKVDRSAAYAARHIAKNMVAAGIADEVLVELSYAIGIAQPLSVYVDTYGGRGAHGGGAFSGKDSSKVDRSAAYAARHIAKNMVAAGIADEVLVELSYAIGIAQPLSVYVDTYGTSKLSMSDGEIAEHVARLFDLRPAAIVRRFGLKNPIFEATASYGHFGNRPYTRTEKLVRDGKEVEVEVEFFGWEKLDAVDMLKKEFAL
ncbi:MAG: methionine adenosyltransferase, partial [Rikenellaceae bacterium]|nr:methionine adenosyltransferase [Rikenellaceae bacterium]